MSFLLFWIICSILAIAPAWFVVKEINFESQDFTLSDLFIILFTSLGGPLGLVANIIAWFITCADDIVIFRRKK